MAATTMGTAPPAKKNPGINRWDSPWLNGKLIAGCAILLIVVLIGLIGPIFWDVRLARVASSPLNLPPIWAHPARFPAPQMTHPLGTESNGRDILALLITGAPQSLAIGVIAACIGTVIGVILGFTAGFLGGWVDAVIRTVTDAVIVIPSLLILIVLSSYVRQIEIWTMALILALFSWAGTTTCLIRAQVLAMRERGYVRMARLSAQSTPAIMFREMMPNLLPYLAASLAGGISAAILAAASLEALGLGPSRIPTLGMTIFYAIRAAAILRGMWWWWGFPILILMIIFTAFFLIATGLDEIANPRLRRVRAPKT